MEYANKVVQVVVYGKSVSCTFPVLNEQPSKTRGSGFFVNLLNESVPRHIITAAHVVDTAFIDGGVKVILPLFGQQELSATVKVIVPEIDLAVLEMDVTGKEKYIDAFPVGNDHNLQFGSDTPILVLGYPLGQEQLKVLRCNFSGRQDMGIQTDCAMNKGNSGGPIVYNNEIVGWVSSGVSTAIANNVSWAIPINQFTAMLPLIVEKLLHNSNTPVIHTHHIGIMYHNSSNVDSTEECQGVVIQFVSAHSVLAGKAHPGDKICSIEFLKQMYKLDTRGEVSVPWYFSKLPFAQIAAEIPVDEPVTFYIHDKDTKTIKKHTGLLTPASRGGYLMQCLRYEPLDYELFGGVLVMPLRANHMIDFPHLKATLQPEDREKDWLVITHIVPGCEIYEMDAINPGDLLEKVNGQKIATLQEFRNIINNQKLSLLENVTFETRDHATVTLNFKEVMDKEKVYRQHIGLLH